MLLPALALNTEEHWSVEALALVSSAPLRKLSLSERHFSHLPRLWAPLGAARELSLPWPGGGGDGSFPGRVRAGGALSDLRLRGAIGASPWTRRSGLATGSSRVLQIKKLWSYRNGWSELQMGIWCHSEIHLGIIVFGWNQILWSLQGWESVPSQCCCHIGSSWPTC